jgi:hypothetical protein
MSPRTFATITAAAVLIVGLLGLFSTVTAGQDADDCGTAVAPKLGAHADCSTARDSRNAWAIPLSAAGLLGLIGARLVRTRPRPTENPAA